MALIDDVKLALRVSGTASNTEITDLIAAADADLTLSGIIVDQTDTLIKRAITLYCKAQYGYDNPEADRFMQSYDMLKAHLATSEEYAYLPVTFTVTAGGLAVDEAYVTFNEESKQTGATGIVVFYAKEGLNYEYAVSKAGYVPQDANVDVTAAKAIAIALVVS